MITLGSGDIMEKANQFLTDQVLMKTRKVLNGVEDDRIGKDGGIERMGGKGR